MLEQFGFTPTQSRVYAALLRLGTSTGYALARDVGVARANVYQALEGMVRRGAVRRSATIPAQYAALPPAALLAELQRSFRQNLDELDRSLRSLPQAAGAADARVGLEAITLADQLVQRAVSCAESARTELLAVTGPWVQPLSAAIDGASRRGIQVRALALGEPAPAGAQLRSVPEAELRAYWGGLPVAVAVDRGQALLGVVLGGGAASGISTRLGGVVPFVRHLLRRETAGGT